MTNESEDTQSLLDGELETLRSIYVNELDVEYDEFERPCSVAITLHPSTADNVEEQYVRMSLIFNLALEYPESIPEIAIRNPRGLSDEKLNRITEDLIALAGERKGGIMLFELIEVAKEHLTAGNRPSGACAICLYGFSDEDIFTKTECYHYFHSHCIARYIQHGLHKEEEEHQLTNKTESDDVNKVLCPMCRVPITTVGFEEDFPPPTSSADDDFALNPKLSEWQKQMSVLYQKQLSQGGIIDIEAEKNRFLLEISNVPSNPDAVISEALSKATLSENDVRDEVPEFTVQDTGSPVKDPKSNCVIPDKMHSNRNESFRQKNYRKPNERYSNESNRDFRWRGRGNNFRPFQGNSRSGYREQRRGGRNGSFRTNRKPEASPEFEPDSSEALEKKSDLVTEETQNIDENTENQDLGSTQHDLNKYETENGDKASNFQENTYKAPYGGKPYRNYNDYNRGYHKGRNSDYYQKSYSGGRSDSRQSNNSYRYSDSASTSSRYRTNNSNLPRSGYRGKPRYSSNYDSARTEDNEESELLQNESSKNSGDNSYSSNQDRSNSRQTRNDGDEKRHDIKPVNDGKRSPNYSKKYVSEDTSDYSKGSWNNRTHYGPSYSRGNARKSQYHDEPYRNHNYRRYRSENRDETVGSQAEVSVGESQAQDTKFSNSQSYDSPKSSDLVAERKPFNASKTRYTNKRNYNSYTNRKNYISEKVPFRNDLKTHDYADTVENEKYDTSLESHSTAETQLVDSKEIKTTPNTSTPRPMSCESKTTMLPPPPGFANPLKKIIYGLPSVNPPPGFHQS